MRRLLTLVCAATLLAATGAAAQPETLTLTAAVERALAGSHLLGAADAAASAAEAGAAAARSGRLPRIELTEDFSHTTNPTLVFSNKLGQERFTAADFDPDLLNNPDAFTNWATRLTVFAPVWTGGRLKHGIAAAEHAHAAAVAGRERTRQEVVRQVIDAYTGAVVALRQLTVAEEARKTAEANVRLVADLREGGLVVESDLLAARVRLAEVEEMVIRAEAGVTVSAAVLNLTMGEPLERPWTLAEDLSAEPPEAEELDALVAAALASRPDLAATAAQVEAAASQRSLARAGRLPDLGLSGFAEANGEDPLSGDGTNWALMVGLRWTAFDGFGRRERLRQAEAREEEARRLATFGEQQAALEVRRAFAERAAAAKRLEQARAAVGLAEASLEIVSDRYRNGLATSVELLDAETRLTEAKSRRVAVTRDLLSSRAALDLAVGRL